MIGAFFPSVKQKVCYHQITCSIAITVGDSDLSRSMMMISKQLI